MTLTPQGLPRARASGGAGGAWTAGVLASGGGRHGAGRETAPARAWRELEAGAWCALAECAPRLLAPSGSGAEGRERRAALSFAALSPKGVLRCRASSKTRSPYEAVNAAIACVSARPAARPRQLAGLPAPALPGCQPLLKRVRGSAPHNPGRRSPSRVGVGGEVEGRHCGAVQDRRALRGCLAWPGEVVGGGASRWPGVTARQDLATRGPARRRWRSRWARRRRPAWPGRAVACCRAAALGHAAAGRPGVREGALCLSARSRRGA